MIVVKVDNAGILKIRRTTPIIWNVVLNFPQ